LAEASFPGNLAVLLPTSTHYRFSLIMGKYSRRSTSLIAFGTLLAACAPAGAERKDEEWTRIDREALEPETEPAAARGPAAHLLPGESHKTSSGRSGWQPGDILFGSHRVKQYLGPRDPGASAALLEAGAAGHMEVMPSFPEELQLDGYTEAQDHTGVDIGDAGRKLSFYWESFKITPNDGSNRTDLLKVLRTNGAWMTPVVLQSKNQRTRDQVNEDLAKLDTACDTQNKIRVGVEHLFVECMKVDGQPYVMSGDNQPYHYILMNTGDMHVSRFMELVWDSAKVKAMADQKGQLQPSDQGDLNDAATKYLEDFLVTDVSAAKDDVFALITGPILHALDHLNTQGYLHKGLSPYNIFLTVGENPSVKLGISRAAVEATTQKLDAAVEAMQKLHEVEQESEKKQLATLAKDFWCGKGSEEMWLNKPLECQPGTLVDPTLGLLTPQMLHARDMSAFAGLAIYISTPFNLWKPADINMIQLKDYSYDPWRNSHLMMHETDNIFEKVSRITTLKRLVIKVDGESGWDLWVRMVQPLTDTPGGWTVNTLKLRESGKDRPTPADVLETKLYK